MKITWGSDDGHGRRYQGAKLRFERRSRSDNRGLRRNPSSPVETDEAVERRQQPKEEILAPIAEEAAEARPPSAARAASVSITPLPPTRAPWPPKASGLTHIMFLLVAWRWAPPC